MKKIITILVLVIGITFAVSFGDQFDINNLQLIIGQSPVLAPLIFTLIYIVGTIFFLPGSVLTLAGGALFGPISGTIYNLTGATIGAIISFVIARYLASGWVEDKTGGKLKQLITGVEKEGWRFVAFTRLVPLFPFNLLNYGLGLSKIKLSHYSLATAICMLPGAFAYTYLGYIGKEAATGGDGLIQKAMIAFTLLGLVAFLPKIISSIRKSNMLDVQNIKQRLDNNEDFLLLDVRTPEDYQGEQGHIQGSTLVPLEQLEKHLNELSDYQQKPVVTICRTDRKSSKAAKILLRNGFTDVHVVKMGMTDWVLNNLPTKINN